MHQHGIFVVLYQTAGKAHNPCSKLSWITIQGLSALLACENQHKNNKTEPMMSKCLHRKILDSVTCEQEANKLQKE